MKNIWKYELDTRAEQVIQVPAGAKILTMQLREGNPCLWVMVDESQLNRSKLIRIYHDGQQIPDDHGTYVGTFSIDGAFLAFHVFESDE